VNLRAARAELLARPALPPAELREQLTQLADRWLIGLLGDEPDVALVAVGGYGRRELAPGSDLDLVLLHAGRRDVGAIADRIWYPIWDSGVGLDHAVRTVAEAVGVARTDLKAALGLLDVRHIAGDSTLTSSLGHAVRAAWRGDAGRRLPDLLDSARERAARFGELAFLLEPDLKEARGGLRDVHAIHAAAAAWMVDAPDPAIRAGYELLLDVRVELHRRTGRGSDRLVLQEQDGVAAGLRYSDADALMTAVYGAARTIAFGLDSTSRRVLAALAPPTSRLPWRRGRVPATRTPLADGVVAQAGEVVLARDAVPAEDPALLLRAAAASAQSGLALARHTLERLVAESAPLPDPWPAAARDALLGLLGTGPPAVLVLEALDQAGLLTRILPEWDRVRCRPQRNAYHRFTVDRHLTEAAAEAAALTRQVARPDLLLLGALLHDIGKGFPGDHAVTGVPVAAGVARRVGLPSADVDTVGTLVRHHLLLADTATRRDLDDPATVAFVVDAVRDRDTLAVLHALTEADGKATGPAAWGDWKAGLVGELVRRVDSALAVAGGAAVWARDAPDRLNPSQRELAQRGEFAVHVEDRPAGHEVTVVAPDRPGLLWRSAGVLALHRLDVRAATAATVGRTAVTVFDVTPRFGSPPDWDLVRADIRYAFDDALALGDRLADRDRAYRRPGSTVPPRVVFVDDASSQATVVEVRAHDSPGLLYRITRALSDCGLDVRAARVSTLGTDAVDAFYVVGRDERPLVDPVRRSEVVGSVLTSVSVP